MDEKEFIGNALLLLALDHSVLFHDPATRQLINTERENPPGYDTEVFDAFTDNDATRELYEAIDRDGLLHVIIKAPMGITSDNESPHKIRVLNVGDEQTTAGLAPVMPRRLSHDELAIQVWRYEMRNYQRRLEELKMNAPEFRTRIGMETEVPPAWTTSIDGVQTLVIPLPVAQKLLHPEIVVDPVYRRFKMRADLAIVRHEFVHTQDWYLLDGHVYHGVSAGELRAEFFSGNVMGYQDVKSFFRDLVTISDIDVFEYMRTCPKGGSGFDFFAMLGRDLGIQSMLEIALMPPSNYVEDSRGIQKSVASHIGGYDNVLRKLYIDSLRDPGKSRAMDRRINDRAATMA